MLEEFAALFKSGWTPGAVGIYAFGLPIVVMLAIGLWKGLPALLDAWTRRADAEALRIDREVARLERQIEGGETRHKECEDRCTRLHEEVSRLNKVIDGLIRQFRQLQISAVRVGMDEPPTVTSQLIAELDRIPGGDLR